MNIAEARQRLDDALLRNAEHKAAVLAEMDEKTKAGVLWTYGQCASYRAYTESLEEVDAWQFELQRRLLSQQEGERK